MAYQPDPPFPKGRGDGIRSKDWNDAVTEVTRLDGAKLDRSGGTVSGNLTVTGNLTSGGTISGVLANGSVGQNQLVNGSVTNPKLAAGAVTTDKIQIGAVSTEKLLGNFFLRNGSFTLGNGIGTRLEVQLTADPVPSTTPNLPTPFVFPLMFVSSTSAGAQFSWTHFYTRFLDFDTFDYVGAHRVRFEQLGGGPIEIRLTVFALRWF
jgi:hypothetical protein